LQVVVVLLVAFGLLYVFERVLSWCDRGRCARGSPSTGTRELVREAGELVARHRRARHDAAFRTGNFDLNFDAY
jgi:hypothetical protein